MALEYESNPNLVGAIKVPFNVLGADKNYRQALYETVAEQVEGLGRRPNSNYNVGEVVYPSSRLQYALTCTTAGTSDAADLDISANTEGDTITDGTMVWKVVKRNYLGSDGVLPIANGGTGATTVAGARNALGLGNTTGALPISNGGTGATTASDACANIGALPTAGGAMSDTANISSKTDAGRLNFWGGTDRKKGATLLLFGKDAPYYPGTFVLEASNGKNTCNLYGNEEGVLTWGGNTVLTCATTYNSTSKQNVLKFSDGTMVICGIVTTNTSAYVNITYDVPFIAIPYSFTCAKMTEGELLNYYTGTSEETATGLQVKTNLMGVNSVVMFMSLGRWK